MSTEPDLSDEEQCDKCGEVGEDRRTLWMACFYAMDELSIPFKQAAILGRYCEQDGEEELPILGRTVPTWSEPRGKGSTDLVFRQR